MRFALTWVIGYLTVMPAVSHAVDPAVLKAQQRRVAVVERVSPAVVAIFGASGRGGGSGVLISPDGYALTNFHVTRGAGNFMKCGLSDGKLYDAVIVGIDPTGDVALIKLLGRNDFPHAPLGDSDKVKPGHWAYAMGNPFLLATDFKPTVTYGIVSGVHRYQYPAGNNILEYTDCIQIDTSINPGNSGGPLFNDDGEVVGINGRGSFEKRGRVNSGAGYAISINQIKNFMGHLRSGRIVDHATLGAVVETTTDGSVVVTGILDESEAARRGLESGDELVSFAGRPIRSVNQYKNILGIYPRGWKLPLVYRRDARTHEIAVRLRALHRKSAFQPSRPRRPMPPPGGPRPKPGDRPRPTPMPPGRAAPKPPEKFKHMYVKKDGYANYYFNELEQKRVLKTVKSLGDYSNATGPWTIAGKTIDGVAFTFTLDDKQTALKIGDKTFSQPLDKDFADIPAGTGGLLIAMHNLRSLLIQGGPGNRFATFYYLGTEPLDGDRSRMVDVLVSEFISADTGDKVECRWYVAGRKFVGFDTWLDKDADECRVRFGGIGELTGRRFPTQLTVEHATGRFASLQVERLDAAK